METITPSEKKTPAWAGVIIVLRAALGVVQSAVLFKLMKNEKKEPLRDTAAYHTALPPAPAAGYGTARSPLWRGRQQPLPYESADPLHAFSRMEDSMNRLFANLLSSYAVPMTSSLANSMAGFDFMPTIDVEETKDAYVVNADLPGLDKDKIQITVRENILTIRGVRESASESRDEAGGIYAQERSYGSFSRSVELPGAVDETAIKAEYANGVLKIRLPKKAGAENNPTKVPVQ
jgi:HSP20 family protein